MQDEGLAFVGGFGVETLYRLDFHSWTSLIKFFVGGRFCCAHKQTD
uniref:Uncharacterized protein n=1 Tax=Rhizophora mucronata TaxID=61149 RepID=A0A2P2R161_RHIMU